MIKFLFLFLFAANSYSQLPNWLAPKPKADTAKLDTAKPSKVVYKTRVKTDTLFVRDTLLKIDTLVKVDTLRDTVYHWNAQYKYRIRYALTSLNVDISNPEWLDYASVNEIMARDTATLRIGSEEVRTLGNIIDNFGNKVPQTDIVTTGFTIQILGDKVVIEYRGKNSLAMFSGNFDNHGLLFATGEITETQFLASFFPLNLFFYSSKKKIIIEIFREVQFNEALL